MSASDHLSPQQFFHGTRRRLKIGGELVPGIRPNFINSRSDKVYITPDEEDAHGWANSAQGRGRQRVYRVEPIGKVEDDPEGYGHTAPRARVVEKVFENKPRESSAKTKDVVNGMFERINAERAKRNQEAL